MTCVRAWSRPPRRLQPQQGARPASRPRPAPLATASTSGPIASWPLALRVARAATPRRGRSCHHGAALGLDLGGPLGVDLRHARMVVGSLEHRCAVGDSTDSAPIIRIQPKASPRPTNLLLLFQASLGLATVFNQHLSFIRARSPCKEPLFVSGSNSQ